MFKFILALCERFLRIPPPPGPPPGDEATTRSFRAAPNFYKYLMCVWGVKSLATAAALIFWLVLIVPALMGSAKHHGWGSWRFLIVAMEAFGLISTVSYWIYSWCATKLDYEKRWYVVTDRSLRVREGIVTVREATVTFANIQNISISQGPIQRLLGIADLRVDTAGGGGAAASQQSGHHNLHTTFFRGVDNANEIRELMQQRLRQLKDAGLGDHDDPENKPVAQSTPGMLDALREIHAETVLLRNAARHRC